MAIVRTLIWVVVTAILVLFAVNNWTPIEVRIWQGLVLETKLPALIILAFLLGLVPMWAVHRAAKWRLNRRVASLQANIAAPVVPTTPAAPVVPPA